MKEVEKGREHLLYTFRIDNQSAEQAVREEPVFLLPLASLNLQLKPQMGATEIAVSNSNICLLLQPAGIHPMGEAFRRIGFAIIDPEGFCPAWGFHYPGWMKLVPTPWDSETMLETLLV